MFFNLIFLVFAISHVTAGNTLKRIKDKRKNDLKIPTTQQKSTLETVIKVDLAPAEFKEAKQVIEKIDKNEFYQQKYGQIRKDENTAPVKAAPLENAKNIKTQNVVLDKQKK